MRILRERCPIVIILCLAVGLIYLPGTATANDLKSKQTQLDALRSEVSALTAKMLIKKVDLQIVIPYAPIIAAVSKLNQLPEPNRTIIIQSTGANGHLWQDSATWCNSFVELRDPRSLQATAVLSGLNAKADTNGAIELRGHISAGLQAKLHWQFKGRRVSGSVMGVKIGGGICPPGGGVGGTIGGSGHKDVDLLTRLSFSEPAGSGVLGYSLQLVSPSKTSMTLSLGFQHIGNLGIPMDLPLPVGNIATGTVPLLLSKNGQFVVGGVRKEYSVTLTPAGFSTSQAGLIASWNSKISAKNISAKNN